MSADIAAANAAAAPQAHLNDAPAALLPAHLPVPTLDELDILRYLEGMSLDGHDPQLHPLSDEQAQLLEEEFNLLTLSTKDTGASDDNAPIVLGKNAAATRIQAMARGCRTPGFFLFMLWYRHDLGALMRRRATDADTHRAIHFVRSKK